jgi:hypothetical protein
MIGQALYKPEILRPLKSYVLVGLTSNVFSYCVSHTLDMDWKSRPFHADIDNTGFCRTQ